MRKASLCLSLLVGLSLSLTEVFSAGETPKLESETAEPSLTYGRVEGVPLPKTVLFSVGPDQIAADAEEWSKTGINAFFLNFIAREWSTDIWAADGKPWTIGESDDSFQKAKKANEICKRIGSDTFLKVAFDNNFEWFNDVAWQRIYNNFRQFAIFARETGCTGMALDIEYVNEQYDFFWEGYTYEGYTRKDLVKKIDERMTKVMQVLYDEFPDMVFLTFPEEGLSLGTVVHVAWIEEAARRNAPGGVHYCTEYTYRNPNVRYMFGHVWACNELFHRLLSDKAWDYWVKECSIAEGIWPFGFNYQATHDPGLSHEEFRQGFGASLMASRRYNWIYSHQSAEKLIGRGLEDFSEGTKPEIYLEIMAKKEQITTPKYVALAKELRDMKLRDYSEDLGIVPSLSFAGPADNPQVRLVPLESVNPEDTEKFWDVALRYYKGEEVDFEGMFGTQTEWWTIGPFANGEGFAGHHAVYPPEKEIDLEGVYDGLNGKVRWQSHKEKENRLTVDFTKIYQPTEHVCAYALCYVTSPEERDVQIRVGTNDSGKVWLGDKLVLDYPQEGTAYLDREIIPVTLPAGTTPILIKICNGENNWGFAFRITDQKGRPAEGLTFSLKPPE